MAMTKAVENKILGTMQIIEDTREKACQRHDQRQQSFPAEVIRRKLSIGDYSCRATLPDGTIVDLSNVACIDRKYGLEELIKNLSSPDRERFLRELERAAANGMHMYILVEEPGGWEKVINGNYPSRFNKNALLCSIQLLRVKYGAIVDFVAPEHAAEYIYSTLRSELKYYLRGLGQDREQNQDVILTPYIRELAEKYHWTLKDLEQFREDAAKAHTDLESYLYVCETEYQYQISLQRLKEVMEMEAEMGMGA